MPGRDGTGPAGQGKGGGLGQQSGTGFGGGRMGGPASAGPVGYCQCPKCGTKVKHLRAEPCTAVKCPQCGSKMLRV